VHSRVDPRAVSVRDLSEADIGFVVYYWFHSPPGYVESLGADPTKLPAEAQFTDTLRKRIHTNAGLDRSKLSTLAILYEGLFIGFHNLNPLVEGDYGIFHAHIARPEFRRRGVAECSYPLACRVFLERFDLKRILFKTPVQNVGAVRVKEKLGIRFIGEEIVDFGIIRSGTRAKVFELTREEAGVAS
jgi:RimJ/RimL family protein N-acetyltransferase